MARLQIELNTAEAAADQSRAPIAELNGLLRREYADSLVFKVELDNLSIGKPFMTANHFGTQRSNEKINAEWIELQAEVQEALVFVIILASAEDPPIVADQTSLTFPTLADQTSPTVANQTSLNSPTMANQTSLTFDLPTVEKNG